MEGISFIVRVKNEEEFLERSIRSLIGITAPHDIHIILNNCTDRSKEIAELLQSEGMPIHIYTYDYSISRAGYENLVTDETSDHSLVKYYTWCFNKGKHDWLFKWDADFIMTDELKSLINTNKWIKTDKFTCYYLQARNVDSNSAEDHLFSGPFCIKKYIFWEFIAPIGERIQLDAGEAHMLHLSELKKPKSYWLANPWFMDSNKPEAIVLLNKYKSLIEVCGSEPVGSARRANPDNDLCYFSVRNNEEQLKPFGINFYC